MKNKPYYLTAEDRRCIVHIDLLKNGDHPHMPEDKNRPHLYNPALALQPDANPFVTPQGYAVTIRVAADNTLKREHSAAVGKVVLVDLERKVASLRTHLPRPIGYVVGVYGNGTVDVQLGADPYFELRRERADFRQAREVLKDQNKELANELSEALQKLEEERKKRIVDVQAREAAEKQVANQAQTIARMFPAYDFEPLRSYSFPSWSSMRTYSSFPTIRGVDLGLADYAKLETQAMSKLLSDWYKVAAPKPAPKAPKAPEPDMGTTGDGSRIEVAKMTDAHLHFAIAKAYRMEYPGQRCRQLGVQALKREAARRLQGFGVASTNDAASITQLRREVDFEKGRREEQGRTNARLNVELDALKSQVARVWKDPNQEAKVAALQAEIERLKASAHSRVAEVSKMCCNANELALKERQAAEAACAETMKLRGEVNKLRANLDATQKVAGQLQERLTIIRDATH